LYDTPTFINETPWPRNWYQGHRGGADMRLSIEQSINVNAVKALAMMGHEYSVEFLKSAGVTTIVEEGAISDINLAALALGGMSVGIAPLEMAGAYGIFANSGVYNKPVSYTLVTNRNGDVLLENVPANTRVMDEGAAFIMTDILRTTITRGFAWRAGVPGRSIAGKTGTTNENYDAWFIGFSPEYVAALWIGNDVNLELSEGSLSAARLWGRIMTQVLEGLPESSFPAAPENVTRIGGEYFISGTQNNPIHENRPIIEEEEDEDENGEEYENGETVTGETPVEDSVTEEEAPPWLY